MKAAYPIVMTKGKEHIIVYVPVLISIRRARTTLTLWRWHAMQSGL